MSRPLDKHRKGERAKRARIEFRVNTALYRYLERVGADLGTTPHIAAQRLCEKMLDFERRGLLVKLEELGRVMGPLLPEAEGPETE